MSNKSKVLVVFMKSAKLLKIFKSVKVLKVVISFASMAIFAVCESAVMGMAFALALVVLLFIHEIGHVIALKIKGYGLRLPLFIPFLGAAISAPPFDDRDTEAYVGYGGPFLGTIAAVLFSAPYL